jgi:hypothetical protein
MARKKEIYYCKHCDTMYLVVIDEMETGDRFLVCPTCNWKHYRCFENGVAIHANVQGQPVEIRGRS